MKRTVLGQGVLNVVLCWHMHQPDYRHRGAYLRPWTWLHAIKDYSDMAAHLEDLPDVRAVVNFSPVLMLQLQDIALRIRTHLDEGAPIGDPILDALAGTLAPAHPWQDLTRSLLRVNEKTMKPRFEPYARLYSKAESALAANQPMCGQDMADLVSWYVLLWLGESVRTAGIAVNLQQKPEGFTAGDRRQLLSLVENVMAGLLPRYAQLEAQGRIELSVTPFSHPILPLLADPGCAAQAMPGISLPEISVPHGQQRCDWQMTRAIQVFQDVFGHAPMGCWPSEGALSDATLQLLSRHGFHWTASGAGVLFNSLSGDSGLAQLSAWQVQGPAAEQQALTVYFRDDELSDRIGFQYATWDADAAVDDFVAQLEQRLDAWLESPRRQQPPVLSMIMDGENAWEYFPRNGSGFLSGLYRRLARHPRLNLTTFSALSGTVTPRPLPALVAGSWVYGTFSTWIGDAAKNRAWELLAHAALAVEAALRPTLEQASREGRPPPAWTGAVLHQLAVCEASDWFWWLGEDNRLEDGPAFDLLFRQQLAGLYQMLGMVPPDSLEVPVNSAIPALGAEQSSVPAPAGAMRPGVIAE